MTRHVVGYLFDYKRQWVALIKKKRPATLAGRWNGVGGRVEEGELPHAAMEREFLEETGLPTEKVEWEHFATMLRPTGAILFYHGHTHRDRLMQCRQTTDEEVEVWSAEAATMPRNSTRIVTPYLILAALHRQQNIIIDLSKLNTPPKPSLPYRYE